MRQKRFISHPWQMRGRIRLVLIVNADLTTTGTAHHDFRWHIAHFVLVQKTDRLSEAVELVALISLARVFLRHQAYR